MREHRLRQSGVESF
ncbi:uncharacterized protein FFMR_15862 [Fusarium fujikuroi]|nr:uncharacterized protein FFMR_15862 [Fusarium fujikuroi]